METPAQSALQWLTEPSLAGLCGQGDAIRGLSHKEPLLQALWVGHGGGGGDRKVVQEEAVLSPEPDVCLPCLGGSRGAGGGGGA